MSAMNRRRAVQMIGAAAVGIAASAQPDRAAANRWDHRSPVIVVDPKRRLSPVSRLLTGVNNNLWFDDSQGLYDPIADAPDPDVVTKTARAGIGLIRYPGGTSANLFDFKRAIGPQDRRGPQLDARAGGGPVDSRYGPDEHMQFVAAAGGEAQIMVSFARGTAADAADWVGYMNAPVGSRWGDLRAANGHPEPYRVRYWEIGNEHDRPAERYWLSADNEVAVGQYAFGGTQRQTGQRVGTEVDHSPEAARSTGKPGQRFHCWYPPVVPNSEVIFVDGRPWRRVDDLDASGSDDEVYVFAPASGRIEFGDGTSGRIPPKGSEVTADYDSGPHDGFVDFYRAMKAVDPDIDVLATWAPINSASGLDKTSLPQLLAEHGHADDYDGITIHPYTNFARDFEIDGFPSEATGHDLHMLGEANATDLVDRLVRDVRRHAPDRTYVAVSEFGALWFGPHDSTIYPTFNTSMSHVLYMASQWARFADRGLPWVEGNALISEAAGGLRAVLGGEPAFVFTAEAIVREQLQPLVTGGGVVVRSAVRNNVTVNTVSTPLGSCYDALVTTASVDRRDMINLLVVNRSRDKSVDTQVVVPTGSPHRSTVRAGVVSGAGFTDFNSADHPADVQVSSTEAEVSTRSFRWTFPAHSVTLLRLPMS